MSKFSDKINNLPKTKKIRYLVLLAIVLLIAVSLVIIFWYSETVLKKTQKPVIKLTISEKLYRTNNTLMSQGSDVAIKESDSYINSTSDNNEKATLYMAQAGIYFDEKDYAKALELAFKSDAINSNKNTSQFIARTYEALGDNKKSIEYYNKAIQYLKNSTETDPLAGYYIEYYQSKIKELE